jgi:subtilisin family serine protease
MIVTLGPNGDIPMPARRLLLLLLPILALLASPLSADPGDYEHGEIILALNDGYDIESVVSEWGLDLLDAYPQGNLYLLYAESVEELEDFAEALEEDPAVLWAEANYFQQTPEEIRQMVILAIGGTFVDYEDQEIAARIGVDEAHLVTQGEGVKVAVLDSGVDPAHEALVGHLGAGGYDFLDGDPDPWEEANGVDDDGDGSVDEGYGHGTMVAGIVALVAPAAEILPVRVLDDEGHSDAYVISKAISHARQQGVDVISMSLGAPLEFTSIGNMIEEARSQGIVAIAGAGNENRDSPAYFPAIHDDVFMIAALDSLDRKADFSDWHQHVLVSAPGTGVRSAYPEDRWGLGSGCSFATPFISGEAALILSLWPDLSVSDVEERVASAVDPIDEIPENEDYEDALGSGRVYLPKAVEDGSAGVGEVLAAAQRDVAVFPNPSPGAVRLEAPWIGGGANASMTVFDAAGRVVRPMRISGSGASWDGRDRRGEPVASGVYYVRFQDTGRSGTARIRIVR